MINNVFNKSVYQRYLTLEKNIKSNSNSFYDSFLDLLEATVKFILDDKGIEYDYSKPCGYILNSDQVKDFYINTVGVDEKLYESLKDKIKKCNDSKHKKEKNVDAEAVVSSMRLYISFANRYLSFTGRDLIDFNPTYFSNMLGESEKTNEKLDSIQQDLASLKNAMASITFTPNKKDKENINQVSNKPKTDDLSILRRFVSKAKCSFKWFGNEKDFKKEKLLTVISFAALWLIGITTTILSSIYYGYYSIWSLIENIYLLVSLFLTLFVMGSNRFVEQNELADKSTFKFITDEIGIKRRTGSEKRRYSVFRIFVYLMPLLNTISLFASFSQEKIGLMMFTIGFEFIFFIITIVSKAMYSGFVGGYDTAIYLEGHNETTNEPVTIVATLIDNQLYEKEDFEKKYSQIN